jgi:hypothetical protein
MSSSPRDASSSTHLKHEGPSRFENQKPVVSEALAIAVGQGYRWSPPRYYMAMNKKGQRQQEQEEPRVQLQQSQNDKIFTGPKDLLMLNRTPGSSLLLSAATTCVATRHEYGKTDNKSTIPGTGIPRWPSLVPFPQNHATIIWGNQKHVSNSQRNLLLPDEELDPVEQVHMYHPKAKHFDDNVFVAFDLCY